MPQYFVTKIYPVLSSPQTATLGYPLSSQTQRLYMAGETEAILRNYEALGFCLELNLDLLILYHHDIPKGGDISSRWRKETLRETASHMQHLSEYYILRNMQVQRLSSRLQQRRSRTSVADPPGIHSCLLHTQAQIYNSTSRALTSIYAYAHLISPSPQRLGPLPLTLKVRFASADCGEKISGAGMHRSV
ncbi:hypothetical protein BJX70DRAFT_279012 [Aspergillus crustosus]